MDADLSHACGYAFHNSLRHAPAMTATHGL
jgi:hypothetical protein